jgi:hypothetical protein
MSLKPSWPLEADTAKGRATRPANEREPEMAGAYGEIVRTVIQDRDEFDTYLIDAQVKMTKLIQGVGSDPVLSPVLRQLEAIEQWTSNGANMTSDQKKRIVMGLQAHREMADFPVEQDLVLALNNYILRTMPTAPSEQHL